MKQRQDQACNNCYYVGRPKQVGAGYVCLKNPPTLQWVLLPQQEHVLDPSSVRMQLTPCGGWPSTEPAMWCGEWRPVEGQ
jgi:hypothetical protein